MSLKSLRESAGYSKRAVSKKLKISEPTYFYMETSCKQFRASMIKKLAAIYKISVTKLIDLMAEAE